jgi:hypothetical protein
LNWIIDKKLVDLGKKEFFKYKLVRMFATIKPEIKQETPLFELVPEDSQNS